MDPLALASWFLLKGAFFRLREFCDRRPGPRTRIGISRFKSYVGELDGLLPRGQSVQVDVSRDDNGILDAGHESLGKVEHGLITKRA